MLQLDYNARLDGECPTCGGRFRFKLDDVRRSRTVHCPKGHSIQLDKRDLDREVRDFGRKVDEGLRRVNVNVRVK